MIRLNGYLKREENYMDIRNKFIKDFPIPKGNKDNPYIILFDGYTGMGKSTVAKVIAKNYLTEEELTKLNDLTNMF